MSSSIGVCSFDFSFPDELALVNLPLGELVSSELMLALVKYQMAQSPNAKLFVVEGYPRSLAQVQEFEREVRIIVYLAYAMCY